MSERINERGNLVITEWCPADRYLYDFKICTRENGWQQYDTEQDAAYFGVWVHVEKKFTFTYCEGDCILVKCGTDENFKAELRHMAGFYGPPPPAFVMLGQGTVTEVYDVRPE